MESLAQVPTELAAASPRPLPPWARRRTPVVLHIGAGGTCWLAGLLLLREAGATALIPFGIGAVFLGEGWMFIRERRLLRNGNAVAAGLVREVNLSKGSFGVSYTFETPRGRFSGTEAWSSSIVAQQFGFRPRPGDTVFLVFDSGNPSSSAVWGFALPPGESRRDPEWWDKPMPRWLSVTLMAVAAGAVLALLLFGVLRLAS